MPALHEPTELAPLVGTPQEVRTRLEQYKAEQVIVVPLAHAGIQQAVLLAQALSTVVSFIGETLSEQNEQTLRALVNAIVPKAPPTPNLLKEAAMLARSRKAVLEGADWLTAARVAEFAGLSATNPSTQPNKWKRERRIFAIHHNGIDYFPGYGLDPEAGWRPRKALKLVLDVFGDKKDSWGLAYWFLSANSFLGGRRPQDVLAVEPEQVVAAAQDEVEGVLHG
ncbi:MULTISPECIES: XRE family transcriptional regulator [Caballeronia]|uniref:XRE family transcriptional regulator n=1 Tax=Caballeronia zhejiangensis TaxID=871203 RepID=A0A656QD88_9BURK|nr:MULTISPECIES: XRE family transcriptional regulator [Caballeronia]KDR26190.1 XRE family transcriptional regulator [Caballeronia zhejiangensis]